jgi:type VII secretion protein EccE
VYSGYLSRRRTATPEPGDDARAALLRHLAPGSTVGSLDFNGDSVGVIEHAQGLCVVLESAGGGSGLVAEQPIGLPSPAVLLPLADLAGPGVTAQVIIQCVPAPSSQSEAPYVTSYRALTNGQIPASRRAWFALQIERGTGEHSDAELRQALAGALRRLLRRLRKDGVEVRALDPDEVLSLLTLLVHSPLPRAGAPTEYGRGQRRAAAQESWSHWSSAAVVQVCLRVRTWPDPESAEGRQFFSRLASAPSLGTTLGIAVRRSGGDLEVQGAIRVAAASEHELENSVAAVVAQAEACGAKLDRLDGEHVFGVAASLPLGGFLS